ncbi:hypothetical protein FACS1894219_09990 [Clostridia bacterium]|nr:hypothetical protein FACS1894219_09990 [Clostridia bacterium]
MSFLTALNSILADLGFVTETGVFSSAPPDEYVVLTPLADGFPLFCDDYPLFETQEVRVSLFCTGNYTERVKRITIALIASGIVITDRRYVGFDADTKYHNYCTDVIAVNIWDS